MKVQGLDRTLADKIFAICDYYMQGKVKKHSRHIHPNWSGINAESMGNG